MAKYAYCSIVILTLLLDACSSTNYTAENLNINSARTADSSLYKMIRPYQDSMLSKMDRRIGAAEKDVVKALPEGALGNLIADLTLVKAMDFSFIDLPENRTFCLLNHGGLRAPLSEGAITVGDVYEVMPFDNQIVVVELTSKKVEELLKYIAEYGGQPAAGIEIEATKNEQWRINAAISGQKVPDGGNYYVVTSDYLAQGGDHMNFFLNPVNKTKSGVLLRDAIMDYIRSQSRPISAKIDGRIKIKNDE